MATLQDIALDFITRLRLVENLNLNSATVSSFFDAISKGYCTIPYHNIEHVKDVCRLCSRIWGMGLGDAIMTTCPEDHDVLALAFITAGAAHDFEHPGLTNDFLIRTSHPYAIAHNDVSPNESHHTAAMFNLLFTEHYFTRPLSPDHARMFRHTIISLIMATDMQNHFSIVTNLRSREMRHATSGEAIIFMQAAFKCADLGHTFQPRDAHEAASKALQEEMFQEGERWQALGWTPPSLMDRALAADFPSAQLGFFRYVVIPFLEVLVPLLPATHTFLQAARSNARFWASQVPGEADGSPLFGRAASLPTRVTRGAAAPASQTRSQELPELSRPPPHAEGPPSPTKTAVR